MNLGPYQVGPNDTTENGIYCGDARELAKAIPDESVDLIFTDPPYLRKYLPLYSWLTEFAVRALKPNGFLLVMCGGLYLNQIFRMMDEHLTFFWKYEIGLTGWAAGCIWPYGNTRVNITTRAKPLLAYCKGQGLPRTSTLGLFSGTGSDKRYHAWGQDAASTRYYVDCFSSVGDIIVDPLCGGGTTPAMAKMLARHWLAFDNDENAIIVTRGRVRSLNPLFVPQEQQADLF